ncbi:MAG: hypothetical protein Q8900_08965, partial [Bacillota bacterium]|nr:hypothetical protein [Bacillota bacterium]
KNESFLEYIDGHIAYYAIKDIDKGITLFARHLDWALKSRNEAHKLKFYTASWFLWEKVKILNYNDEYLLRLPKNTPFYVENGKYKTEEILKYCKNQAMNIAVNFNKRDGENTADKYIDEIRMCVLKDV